MRGEPPERTTKPCRQHLLRDNLLIRRPYPEYRTGRKDYPFGILSVLRTRERVERV